MLGQKGDKTEATWLIETISAGAEIVEIKGGYQALNEGNQSKQNQAR